jgi:hypothetical protein
MKSLSSRAFPLHSSLTSLFNASNSYVNIRVFQYWHPSG